MTTLNFCSIIFCVFIEKFQTKKQQLNITITDNHNHEIIHSEKNFFLLFFPQQQFIFSYLFLVHVRLFTWREKVCFAARSPSPVFSVGSLLFLPVANSHSHGNSFVICTRKASQGDDNEMNVKTTIFHWKFQEVFAEYHGKIL
jgi:hypothetical protein